MSNLKYRTFGGEEKNEEGRVTGYSIDEALEHIGLGLAQLRIGIICGIAWIADGSEIMVLSILGPILVCEWGISTVQEGLLTTVVFFGLSLGSALFGYMGDTYGRKKTLILGSLWLLFYAVLCAFSPNLIWLIIIRGLVGVGIGTCPQVITYGSEFLPINSRGKALLSMLIFWTLGSLIQIGLAMLLVPLGWKYWMISTALPVFIFVLSMKFLPRSPRYLLATGRVTEAVEALEGLARSNNKVLPPGPLLPMPELPKARFTDLFTPAYKRTTLLLAYLWFASSFCYYGLVLFSTELVKAGDTCANKFSFGSSSSCSAAPCTPFTTSDYVDISLTSVGELPGILIAIAVIDILGRRRTFMLLLVLFSMGCLLLMICQGRITMLLLLFICRASVTAAFQGFYLYTSEVYPTEFRALAVGSGSAFARVGGLLTPYVAQVLLGFSMYAGLAVYAALGCLAVVATYCLPYETKGKSLVEQQDRTVVPEPID